MKAKKYYFFYILLLTVLACNNIKKADKDSMVIKGSFFNANGAYVYLEELTIDELKLLDSAKVKNDGSFSFRVKPEHSGFYILKLNDNNFVTLLGEKGETIFITADARQIVNTYEIEGSDGSILIKDININLQNAYSKIDSLREEFEKSKYLDDFLDIKTTLDSIYIQIIDSHKNYITTFIDSNPHSLASLIALYQVLGQQPVLSEKEDFTYFEKLADGLIQKYPNNPHSIDLYNRVEEIREFLVEKAEAEKRMGIGNVSPEVSLNNPNGETIHLSSYRGKFVLVNFWASWCAPCRKSNPELVKLHNKYKSKNFEIFSVSLDRNKEAWTAAIELDKLDWVHVSDLAYWSSPIVKLFNIDSIPASYLIDKDGKILYHNLDYKTLDNVLKNLL